MIGPGAVVVCRQTGAVAWVVHSRMANGQQWKLVSKAVDHRGRAVFSGRTAGEGDVVLIAPAPTYEVGDAIEHDGLSYTVAADLGDSVEAVVPSRPRPLRGGGHLHIAAGNTITLSKSDLTLETLR